MWYSDSATLEFSDPCADRDSSVAENRLILISNDSRGRVRVPRLVLLLPGRETVAVRGAAASNNHVKKARNEANVGETQAHGPQKDRDHDPDSGCGNRT